MGLTREKIDELFAQSELVRMAERHFDEETCEMMIEELKTDLENELTE